MKDLSKMTKEERIHYLYAFPLAEAEDIYVKPFIVNGDLDEWADEHDFIDWEEAQQRLSDIGRVRIGKTK